MKIKQVLTSLFILIGMMSLLGGCNMTEEKVNYKKEQDRMVEYLASHYEGIEKVEFTEINNNGKTGTYSFYATVNNKFKVNFTLRGLNGEIYMNQLSSRNHGHFLKKLDMPNEKPDVSYIEAKYLEE
ncbi:DUF1433 domain-containing protein [Streptococcus ruminantium]|uniref:DUF1433 domain-containing protein n=1 Tax=Streptococcus ruminantium TaxID=1917441 RepID=UPI0012DC651E|nr:DUF1433 domain-containing protein [Streptococcus ruminantium]